jgi:uncharacterized protein YqfA (UPF0365 family)
MEMVAMAFMDIIFIVFLVLVLLTITLLIAAVAYWGSYWIQAYLCGADVSMRSLITMTAIGMDPRLIVTGKIMGRQSGIPIDRDTGMSTGRLMAHHLAGGDVMAVVRAIIVAERAGMKLNFDRAAAIDLSGRDVLLAVKTSVTPIVIPCPRQDGDGRKSLSAVARNGVEVLVGLKVTVRTNLEQLVGGATEETIIARVGHAIVSAVGSASSHIQVMAAPSQISEKAMACGLDANTAFSIISIDISDIDLGENIGARLQTDQAMADTLIAQAGAEARRAEAVAELQQMTATYRGAQADLVLAEARLPPAIAEAFRQGNIERSPAATGKVSPRTGLSVYPKVSPA